MHALHHNLIIACVLVSLVGSPAFAEETIPADTTESVAPVETPAEAPPPTTSEDGVTSRGLFPTKVRPLSSSELTVAKSVFRGTINYGLVRVTNALGLNNAPWTSNTPPIYTLNVGTNYSSLTSTSARRNLLIHELTHVWQGQHLVPFMLNSAAHQSLSVINNGGNVAARGDAYSYTLGRRWGQYNVEQQASIVADWFKNGRKTSDPRYRYIRDNIRSNKAF